MIGKSLTHYEVLEKLGEGGMGIVYKARDTRLNRLAALKVLPADKMTDEGRRARFIQEAQAASALNHPNIVTIYEIDRDAGSDFIAMEFIAGQTLDAAIRHHGLKLSETLKYAVQIADALSAAHAAGIVHRDLKPGNVMVTGNGIVKILDFGLAKLTEAPDPSDAATRTLQPAPLTEQGAVLGTVAYMSPEQAEGKRADARSDIFSFGSLLYEMVTGQRAFSGGSRMSIISAILRDEPKPLSQTGEPVPRDLEKIVARCLRKDLARRFQHIDDVKVALEELKEESDSGALAGSAPAPALKNRRGLAVAIGAIVLVGLVTLLAVWLRRDREPASTPTLTPLTSYPGSEERPSFSPDGNQVAFSWNGEKEDNFDIYVKLVGGGSPLRLTSNPAVDGVPAWSPDARQIAFLRNPGEAAVVYLISPLGGPERRLCDAKGDALAWTPDGKSLAIMDRATGQEPYAIALVAVDTGDKRGLSRPPSESVGDAPWAFSPDGQELAFARWHGPASSDLFVLSLKGGEPRNLTAERRTIYGAAWLPGGDEIVFSSNRGGGSGLWRMRATPGAIPRSMGIAGSCPAISRPLREGGVRLAYEQGSQDVNIWLLELGQHPGGTPPVVVAPSTYLDAHPQLSADGKRVAFTSTRSGAMELWLCNRDGSNVAQLTFLGNGRAPRWSPDGSQIAFDARVTVGNLADIYVIRSEGGAPRRLTTWTSDEVRPSWSNDGQWIYFRSDRSGRQEIWKIPSQGGEPVQITRNGGFEAQESPDGNLLYFVKEGRLAGSRMRNYERARRPGGLWQMPLAGGEEKLVLASVSHSYWAVTDKGIYFLDFTEAPSPASPKPIRFFSFETGKTNLAGVVQKEIWRGEPGLSASRDGRWLAWDQVDSSGSDLMLAENLR